MRLITLLSACIGLLLAVPAAHAADGPFAPRLIVNESVITNFEVDQRVLFLKALSSGGDLDKLALDGLVEDRLRTQAAESFNIEISEEDLAAGMTEFASRANISSEEFIVELGKLGVEPETFRDFVRAGLSWRNVVREKFGSRTLISDGEIDRAQSVTRQRGGVRVFLSELILPAAPGQEADALAQAEELRATITSEGDFAEAARQFSAAPSAERGGVIDGLPLGNLPPALRDLVLVLKPGEVTPPIAIPNAVGLFQLRSLQETGQPETQVVDLDYMQVILPEGPNTAAEIARLRAGADRCNDLFGLTKGVLPASQVIRTTEAAGAVPRDIAIELAKLDAGESSAALRRGSARIFLMLCARNAVPAGDEPPTRDQIRNRLVNQRLALLSDGYLAQLRAVAIIREP